MNISQSLSRFFSLFTALFSDYYSLEKKRFWLIQFLIITSTVLSLYWILGLILGITHHANPTQLNGIKGFFFSWLMNQSQFNWLTIISISGILSALTLFLSFKIGVNSSIHFQTQIAKRSLAIVEQPELSHWTSQFSSPPRQTLQRILKQGIQLCGLVSRRMARAFVSLFLFLASFVLLIYLNHQLLLSLMPLAVIYLVVLYKINHNTKNISQSMNELLIPFNQKFNQLIEDVLNSKTKVHSKEFEHSFENSQYAINTELKYKRRLAEIHVSWLNQILLVFGVIIIFVQSYYYSNSVVDWQKLLIFLVVLKYAIDSLAQVSSTTVAFSRFYEEIKLVYQLLNTQDDSSQTNTKSIKENSIIFITTNAIEAFDIDQLHQYLTFNKDPKITHLSEIRGLGSQNYFKETDFKTSQNIILANHLSGLKQFINKNSNALMNHFSKVSVFEFSHELQSFSFEEFQNYSLQASNDIDLDLELMS